MSSADQLFGIRSGTAFEAGRKTIRRVFQNAGLRRNVTFTVLDATTPFCGCCLLHECSPESQGGFAAQCRRSNDSTAKPVEQAGRLCRAIGLMEAHRMPESTAGGLPGRVSRHSAQFALSKEDRWVHK